MSWIPIIALAIITFLIAGLVLRLPRAGWTMFGATLLFGLTGYALQGHPGYAGSPTDNIPVASENNFVMIEARREFFGETMLPSRFVITADAFARKGKYADAANLLGNAVKENPRDTEAWLAMGNALTEQAGGSLTPAAMYAYSRAQELSPANPGPTYFLGVGLLRSGQPDRARAAWAELLENAPADAPWRVQLQDRLDRLDELIAQMGVPGQ